MDIYDVLGIYACLSLLSILGLYRLGAFLGGRLRPRIRRWPTEQHPSYFRDYK